MSEAHPDRGELQAWLDGEAAQQELDRLEAHLRSCQVCRESVSRAAWEVGLFLHVDSGRDAAAPSPDFADRVMARIRKAPREGPAEVPPLRALPPVPPAVRAPRWGLRLAAAAAALVAAVLGGIHVLDSGEKGNAVVDARSGGVLRWHGRFDRSLAGSEWIAQGAAVPALAGEVLHSPSPSSIHLRLPGGGRLDAGPSCFLALGTEGEFALLEGAITADAGTENREEGTPGRLVIEAPGVVATTSGEIEVSVRTPTGARSGPGARWLGAWAASRRDASPVDSALDAPGAAVIVYARRGPVEVAASPGPVRNTLERQVVPEGQALVMLESKTYRMLPAAEDAPPERAGWTEGMPVPPDSRLFRRSSPGATAPDKPTGGLGASPGPVRNTLERVLEERNRRAEDRAYALSVFEGVGGAEAVAAAAGAADDPAVIVRSAAVRVLALNAWADRPKALEALRTLARDRDAGVARYAILALKALDDRDAIPVLKALVVDDDAPPEGPAVVDDDAPPEGTAVVDDDAPPENLGVAPADVVRPHGPREVAKVYAFDALVHFGDLSTVAQAAELETKVANDEVLLAALRSAVTKAFQKLDHTTIRTHVGSESPGVRAAALRALQDISLATPALQDPSEVVRLAAVDVHLSGPAAVGLGDWAPRLDGTVQYKRNLVTRVLVYTQSHPDSFVPDWMATVALEVLADESTNFFQARHCVELLLRLGAEGSLEQLALDPSSAGYAARVAFAPVTVSQVESALKSPHPDLRVAAGERLARLPLLPEAEAPSSTLLGILEGFVPRDGSEASFKAQGLSSLAKDRAHGPAVAALMAMASSPSLVERRNALFSLAYQSTRPEIAGLVVERTSDPDLATAFAAARAILIASRMPERGWAGPAFDSLYPSSSPHASVRAAMALLGHTRGVAGAGEALIDALRACSSADRMRVFDVFMFADVRLQRVDPDLVLDPSPRVRIQILHNTALPARADVATLLRDDPAVWVQATALAYMAEGGDSSAEQQLRTLAEGGLPVTGLGQDFVPGLGPSSPNLVTMVLATSRILGSAGNVVEGTLRQDLAFHSEALLLIENATLRNSAALLDSGEGAASRIRALASMGSRNVSGALAHIVPSTVPAREGASAVREAAARAAADFVGFVPMEGVLAFGRAHGSGVVTGLEVLASQEK